MIAEVFDELVAVEELYYQGTALIPSTKWGLQIYGCTMVDLINKTSSAVRHQT